MKKIILVLLLSLCEESFSQKIKHQNLDVFAATMSMAIMECNNKGDIFYIKLPSSSESTLNSAMDEIFKCQNDARVKIKPLFQSALSEISENKVASEMLKNYYAAVLSSLSATSPNMNINRRIYDDRINSATNESDKIWNRLKIELND